MVKLVAKEAAFHSKTQISLESTNSYKLFSKMRETVLESLAKFQRQGSNFNIPFSFEPGSSHRKV